MTKERIEKELQKVRQQLATLQERQKDLEEQLQMAEDAEKMKFIEKNKISLDRLILLNKVSEEEILHLLKQKEQEEQTRQTEREAVSHEKKLSYQLKRCYRLVYQQYYSVCPQWALP